MQNSKKALISLAVVILLFALVVIGGSLLRESTTFYIPVGQDINSQALDPGFFDQSEYDEESLATYIQNNSDLQENFMGKTLDDVFCFEGEGDIKMKCVRPSNVNDFTEELGVLIQMQRNDELSLEDLLGKPKKEEVSIDPNYFDQSEYPANTIATYIQEHPEVQKCFKGRDLTAEFCFGEDVSEKQSKIKCIIPQELIDGDEVYFDRILEDLLALDCKPNIDTLPFEERSVQDKTFLKALAFEKDFYKEMAKDLEEKYEDETADKDEIESYSYLKALEGDYDKSEEAAQANCEKYEIQCSKDSHLLLEGTVKSGEGMPIESALIEVLSDEAVSSVMTDSEGKYSIEFDTYNFTKVRIKASKVGFSDGVIPINVIDSQERESSEVDFVLHAPVSVVTLNNEEGTFIGEGVSIEGESFIVTTEWSKYNIPFDALVRRDGTPFVGQVDAFLFEFDKTYDIDTLVGNDIFDEVVGYAGNLMKTFGMPYVLFKTVEGETIHVLKSNPMTLQSQIMEMEALYTNQDQIYTELTEQDMEYLYAKSIELGGYPIDREFLIDPDYLLVKFPAFWVFDQVSGVWENIGTKVLDPKGLLEMPFYTLNNT